MKTFKSCDERVIFKNILNTLTCMNLQHIMKCVYSVYFTDAGYLVDHIDQRNAERQRRGKEGGGQDRDSQVYQVRGQDLCCSEHRDDTSNKQKEKVSTSL